MYNKKFIANFSKNILKVYPKFNTNKFKSLVFNNEWNDLELKGRMRHITLSLHEVLPNDFVKAAKILSKLKNDQDIHGFEYMIFPDYVEIFGEDHWDEAVYYLEFFTEIASSEFAVRKYIFKK